MDEAETVVLAVAKQLAEEGIGEFNAYLMLERVMGHAPLPAAGSLYAVLDSLKDKGLITWRWDVITARPHLRLYTLAS